MGAVGVDECELLPRNETRPDNTLGQQKKIIEKNNDKACGGGALVQHAKNIEATAVFGSYSNFYAHVFREENLACMKY